MNHRIILSFALALCVGSFGCTTNRAGHPSASQPSGPLADGLQMSLSVSKSSHQADREFEVAISNVGAKDVCVNLGCVLANGKVQLPSQIHLWLTDDSGTKRELDFADKRYPGIAGRVDDYVVPLRAGSTYTIQLSLDQFWAPSAKEFELKLKPGRYVVSAEFEGDGAQTSNTGMEAMKLMNFWREKLQSNVVTMVQL